jgi:hypothetical protein
MSLRSTLAFATSLVVALAACGGTVSHDDARADGGSAGDGGGDGGAACTTATLPGDRACVPGTARSKTPIEIEIAASQGCLGCFTTFDPCEVVTNGSTITVGMKTRTCPPPGDQACPAICAIPQTKCTLPALAAGSYTLEVSGQGAQTGFAPRTLVVTDDATATSCALPRPGNQPEPLDGTKYTTTCSVDDDCSLATVGEICTPCKCPNLAIAKSSAATYAADYRARSSECTPNAGVACGACAPVKVTCQIEANAVTGTCAIKPGP